MTQFAIFRVHDCSSAESTRLLAHRRSLCILDTGVWRAGWPSPPEWSSSAAHNQCSICTPRASRLDMAVFHASVFDCGSRRSASICGIGAVVTDPLRAAGHRQCPAAALRTVSTRFARRCAIRVDRSAVDRFDRDRPKTGRALRKSSRRCSALPAAS